MPRRREGWHDPAGKCQVYHRQRQMVLNTAAHPRPYIRPATTCVLLMLYSSLIRVVDTLDCMHCEEIGYVLLMHRLSNDGAHSL